MLINKRLFRTFGVLLLVAAAAATRRSTPKVRNRRLLMSIYLLIRWFLRLGRVFVLAFRGLPIHAAPVLHQPGDFFAVADAHVMRLAEPVRLARESNEARRHAAI